MKSIFKGASSMALLIGLFAGAAYRFFGPAGRRPARDVHQSVGAAIGAAIGGAATACNFFYMSFRNGFRAISLRGRSCLPFSP
jgi:membrane associated rhomboid family serine protease